MRSPTRRSVATIMAAGLIFAACGSDDDAGDVAEEAVDEAEEAGDDAAETADDVADDAEDTAEDAADDADDAADQDGEAPADGEELPTEGSVEVGAGTTLNLDECPDDWDPMQGISDDEILLGESLPESGPAAAFGDIGVGMQAYFDYLNENDPIAGREIQLVTRDDAYEAGRTTANVQEMIDSDGVFALVHVIGTPNNLAIRPITADACVPQLFNSTGFPLWGDPANFPWTVGNILNYETETEIWCTDMNERFPDGATVAALINNNDFGQTYQRALGECEGVEVVEEQLHAPDAPDVTNEMTTLAASGADVLVAGTTGAFCTQAAAALAGSDWRPVFYNSYTCNNLASFYSAVTSEIETLGDSAPIMANSIKVCGDPAFDDDPAIQEVRTVLDEYADGTTCEAGSFSTGVLFGQVVEDVLRPASEMPGGLNRVNLMSAVWNLDAENDLLLGGQFGLDGVNDAYITESAQLQQVVVEDGALTYSATGDVIDLEGQGGSYEE